jgi:hypothetical protein
MEVPTPWPHQFHLGADISLFLLYLLQNRNQILEGLVARVIEPGAYLDAVLGLLTKVLGRVVDDDRCLQLPAQPRQVLQVRVLQRLELRVLSEEPVLDELMGVDLVQNPISRRVHTNWRSSPAPQ